MKPNIKLPYEILIEFYIYKIKTNSLEEFFGYLKHNGSEHAKMFYDFNTEDMIFIYNNIEKLKDDLDYKFLSEDKDYDNGEKAREFFKSKFLLKSNTLEEQLNEINHLDLKVKVRQEFTDVEKITNNLYVIDSKIFINTNNERPLDEYLRLIHQLEEIEARKISTLLEEGIDMVEIYNRLDELEQDKDVINYLDSEMED